MKLCLPKFVSSGRRGKIDLTAAVTRKMNCGSKAIMDSAISFHESLASDWRNKYSKPSFRRRLTSIFSLLGEADLNGKDWLDVGCGSGVLSMVLMEQGARVTGMDGSPRMVQEADRKS